MVGSAFAFLMMVGAVFWMHKDYTGFFGLPVAGTPWIFGIGLAGVLYTMASWWRDVIQESVVKGNHTPVVKLHLRYGMLLFIASERDVLRRLVLGLFQRFHLPCRSRRRHLAARGHHHARPMALPVAQHPDYC